jgi:hypothetical protein
MSDKPHEPRDDGGPAFPEAGNYLFDCSPKPGMSLHDWFAGMALQVAGNESWSAELKDVVQGVEENHGTLDEDERVLLFQRCMADKAYAIADAMLAEKRRREAENGNGSQQ